MYNKETSAESVQRNPRTVGYGNLYFTWNNLFLGSYKIFLMKI